MRGSSRFRGPTWRAPLAGQLRRGWLGDRLRRRLYDRRALFYLKIIVIPTTCAEYKSDGCHHSWAVFGGLWPGKFAVLARGVPTSRAGCAARQHLGVCSCVSGAEACPWGLVSRRTRPASARPKASHTIASIARFRSLDGASSGVPHRRLRGSWGAAQSAARAWGHRPPGAGSKVRGRRQWGPLRRDGFGTCRKV